MRKLLHAGYPVLLLLLLAGNASAQPSRGLFGPRRREKVDTLYKVFGIEKWVPIRKGSIVKKNGDTVSGYIDENGFAMSRKLHQVALLPFDKSTRADIIVVKLEAIASVRSRSTDLKDTLHYDYIPTKGSMWTMLEEDGPVVCYATYQTETDMSGNDTYVIAGLLLLTPGDSVVIPVAGAYSFRSDLYYFAKFINTRYGTTFKPSWFKRKEPIRYILEKENQRLIGHLTKTS